MPIRRKIGSTSNDITDALAAEPVTRRPTLMEQATGQVPARPAPTPPVQRGAMRPRQIQGVSPAELQATMRRVAAGGPVTIHANGVPLVRLERGPATHGPADALANEIMRDDAARRANFADHVSRMPAGLIPDDDLAAGIREAAISQTLEGMRANPAMVPMVRELLSNAPPDFRPEDDQLALALARYDAENAPPAPPEPDEPTPTPAPSRPVRNWGDDE